MKDLTMMKCEHYYTDIEGSTTLDFTEEDPEEIVRMLCGDLARKHISNVDWITSITKTDLLNGWYRFETNIVNEHSTEKYVYTIPEWYI